MAVNMKKMTDQLKVFFAQEISASAVKVTSGTNYIMSRKLDQLCARLNKIEVKVSDTKALADDNKTRIENLEGKRNNSSSKLEELVRRLEELEEIVDDYGNCNAHSTLVIRRIILL